MRRPLLRSRCAGLAAAALALPGVAQAAATTTPPALGATVTGTLSAPGDGLLPGMRVEAVPPGTGDCTSDSGCAATYSAPDGQYALSGLAAGRYDLDVLDGPTTVTAAQITIRPSTRSLTRPLRLGPAAVPAGATARRAAMELGWLNAERSRDGVPAGVALNLRWSARVRGAR